MVNRGKIIFKQVLSSPSFSSAYIAKTPDDHNHKTPQTWQSDGENEYLKNLNKFDLLLTGSNKALLKMRSVFPFDLFPDEITVDPMKVNIVSREFFFSATTHTIHVKNILDVSVDCSPFFATLKIMYQGFGPNTVDVKYLKKREAQKARRIIQGLALAAREGVDFSKLDTEELINKVESLGRATQCSAANS